MLANLPPSSTPQPKEPAISKSRPVHTSPSSPPPKTPAIANRTGVRSQVQRRLSAISEDTEDADESFESSGDPSAVRLLYDDTQTFEDAQTATQVAILAVLHGHFFSTGAQQKAQEELIHHLQAKEEQDKKTVGTLVTQLENSKDEANIAKSQLRNSERLLVVARKRQQDSDTLIEGLSREKSDLKKDYEILQVENEILFHEKISDDARHKLVEVELNQLKARFNALCQNMNGEPSD